MKIVTIGGGTGGSIIDESLSLEFPDLVSVVTSFDSGGSSGILRKEFGMLPQGDIRRRIFAQKTKDNKILEEIYNFRFAEGNNRDSSLESHSVGNLMILAATKIWGEKKGIEKICELFNIKGKVLPVTYDQADLAAKLTNGKTLVGEDMVGQSIIDKSGNRDERKIEKVYLTRNTKINPDVAKEIKQAEYIILCPGDFYTSLIPNFLVPGFTEAIKKSKAKIIFVSNLMTKASETKDFKLSNFIVEVEKYLGKPVDHILVNKSKISPKLLKKYKESEQAIPVLNDLKNKDLRVKEVDMLKQNGYIRHDKKLFLEIFKNLIDEDKKKKIYIFDLDDTIVNSSGYYQEFLKRDLKNLKFYKNVDKILKMLGKQNCYLLTHDQHGLQNKKIKLLNLKSKFKEVKVVYERKDKYKYLKSIKDKNKNADIFVVGDAHTDAELEYGKYLGLKTICVAFSHGRHYNKKLHKNYDLVIEQEEDFLKMVY